MPAYAQRGRSQLLATLTILRLIRGKEAIELFQQLIVDLLVFAVAARTRSSIWNLHSVAQIGLELVAAWRLLRSDPLEAMVRYCAAVVAVS